MTGSYSDKPKPRTYTAGSGGSLPSLGTDTRPVGVGRRAGDGEEVPEVRAFMATVRNRGDVTMTISEGDGDDAATIRPGEAYHVPAVNGTDTIRLAAETEGYDGYEIRTIEGHNDFSIVDKIEGFVQSVAMLLRSSRTQTRITGQDVPITIDDAGGVTVTGNVGVSGSVDVGTIDGTVTVDAADGATIPIDGDVSVSEIAGTVAIEAADGTTIPIDGDVSVSEIDGTVNVDTAAGTTIPVDTGTVDVTIGGSNVTIPVDAGTVGAQIEGVDGGVQIPVSIDASTANLDTTLTAADVTLPVSIDGSNVELNTQITGSAVPIDANISGADVDLRTEIVGQVGNVSTTVVEEVDASQTRRFAEFVDSDEISSPFTDESDFGGPQTVTYGVGVPNNTLLDVRSVFHKVTLRWIDDFFAGLGQFKLRSIVGPPDSFEQLHEINIETIDEPNGNGPFDIEVAYAQSRGWYLSDTSDLDGEGVDVNLQNANSTGSLDARGGGGDYFDFELQTESRRGKRWKAETILRYDGVNR